MANKAEFEIELEDHVSPAAKRAGSAVDRLNNKFKSFGGGLSGLGSSFAAVGAGIVSAMAVAGAAVVAFAAIAVAKLGEAAIEAASFAQRSTLAIGLLTHNAAGAGAVFDDVRGEAARLGLDVKDTTKSFQKLLAAQFSIGQAKTFIRLGADLQAIGASADEVQRTLLTLTQIKAKGRLQSEELLQLQEAGISQELVFNALQESMGLDRDGVRKAIEAGKVGAGQALDAIQTAILKKTGASRAGEAGEKFADTTLEGMKNKLKAGVTNAFIDIGQKIQPTLDGLAKKVGGTIDKLVASGKVEKLKASFIAAFQKIGAFIEAKWPVIEAILFAGIDAIIFAFDALGTAVDFVSEHWDKFRFVVIGLGVVLGAVVLGFLVSVAVIGMVVGAVGALIGAVVWLGLKIAEVAAQAWNWGSAMINGLVGGITAGIERVRAAAMRVANAVRGTFQSVFDFGSPSKAMMDLGSKVSQGFAIGIADDAPVVMGATRDMSRGTVGGFADAAGAGGASSVSVTNNINVSGSGKNSGEIATTIASEIERRMVSFFDGLALEGA